MTLKQHEGALVVKKLVDGAPAAESGEIEMGDRLLKVNGKGAKTADEAAKLILGDVGSQINFVFEREIDGRRKAVKVSLIRGKPK
mmetsp:Transcript_20903/g.40636  ORF Transcript_20903/g.40636 Transcript_20903/m.40636 type:complete len:85 (+) Transcript_20903:3-257(+)